MGTYVEVRDKEGSRQGGQWCYKDKEDSGITGLVTNKEDSGITGLVTHKEDSDITGLVTIRRIVECNLDSDIKENGFGHPDLHYPS